jgi:prepilin-type N-terminal cleavage/methylation domain-containing protein
MPAPGKAGYSLVELLVAMTLFAIAALGLSAGVVMVVRSGAFSDDLTRATILAQDKLEELTALGTPLAGGTDTPQAGFNRTWTVSSDDPEAGVTRIDVSVSWEDEAQSIALVTVVNE